jgi:Na+/phosphate symporter
MIFRKILGTVIIDLIVFNLLHQSMTDVLKMFCQHEKVFKKELAREVYIFVLVNNEFTWYIYSSYMAIIACAYVIN